VLSFKKKILISDCILFLFFVMLLFPIVRISVSALIKRSFQEKTDVLIDRVNKTDNIDSMIKQLRSLELNFFFRISLIDNEGTLLYDSHWEKLTDNKFEPNYYLHRKEIKEAIKKETGYRKGYSPHVEGDFAYVARSFIFQGKRYFMRAAFPYKETEKLTYPFQIGLLSFCVIFLLLYGIMTGVIVFRVSKPIQHIINSISPFKEGEEETFPCIDITGSLRNSHEFRKLAETLNSLSERIKKETQQLVDQSHENEAILESLGEGVIAIDSRMRVTFANMQAEKFLERNKDSLIGYDFTKLKYSDKSIVLNKCMEVLIQCVLEDKTLKELLLIGEINKKYLEITVSPKKQQNGAIIVIQDKTSDYKVIAMGKDFVANASHELKTPITVIQGFAETMQDLPDISQNMLKDIASKIFRTSERLSNIIKNLLTLAEVDNLSKQRFYPCDIVDVLSICREITLSVHKDIDIKIESNNKLHYILAETGLIELAICNLLENAVKYSPSPAVISIEVEDVVNNVVVKIKDKGIGIPSHDLNQIFDRFYTVDKARSRKFGGSGLGLSLVKTIIEKHGGNISLNSKVGEGSCFTLFFPKCMSTVEDLS
jgi:two-component system, OmpR family, phosphate regulon sensor histidine kinase PhoR